MQNEIITPNKKIKKKKIGEVYRFKLFMSKLNLKPETIQRDTGVTARTIMFSIYENKPLGPKLLRSIHAKYGVSIDWLISGSGNMFIRPELSFSYVDESSSQHTINDLRFKNIVSMVKEFMVYASDDENAWLETQMKFNLAQFDKEGL